MNTYQGITLNQAFEMTEQFKECFTALLGLGFFPPSASLDLVCSLEITRMKLAKAYCNREPSF